jgi:hypothetical protein
MQHGALGDRGNALADRLVGASYVDRRPSRVEPVTDFSA